jgi:ABC-type branched-subunit amino acid transport system permease subunit
VLGGPGTLVGGAIGASVVVFLREYVSTVVTWWQYILGAVYVLTILYLPGGLMGLPERIRRWRTQSSSAIKANELQSVSH